jgi:hypothetical protein
MFPVGTMAPFETHSSTGVWSLLSSHPAWLLTRGWCSENMPCIERMNTSLCAGMGTAQRCNGALHHRGPGSSRSPGHFQEEKHAAPLLWVPGTHKLVGQRQGDSRRDQHCLASLVLRPQELSGPQNPPAATRCLVLLGSGDTIHITTHPSKAYKLMASGTFRVVQPWPQSILEHLHCPQKNLYPGVITVTYSALCPAPGNHTCSV